MKSIKRSIVACGAALAVSAAALAGTTFAWFTDSITNEGNRIQAGSLKIGGYAYDLGEGGMSVSVPEASDTPFVFEAEGMNLKTSSDPIVNENNFAPGDINAKLLEVVNEGSLDAMVKLNFVVGGSLTDALWFDFVAVADDSTVTGQFMQRPMSSISELAAREFEISANETLRFALIYGMNTSAGNEYQDGVFTADVTILAKQTAEGADYVAAATSESELKTALASGGNVTLAGDIGLLPPGDEVEDAGYAIPSMIITKDTVIDLNGQTLELTGITGELSYTPVLLSVNAGSTLTIEGDGVLNAEADYTTAYCTNVTGGTLVINGGEYYGAMSAVQVQTGKAIINGGFFDLAPTVKEAAPDMVSYLINCIDANYKNGTAVVEIAGGTFVNFDPSNNAAEGAGTNFVADGYTVISEKQSNGDVWYTVVPVEESADSAQSFANALTGLDVAGNVEKIINVESDITGITGIKTAAGNDLTVNFGGNTVTVADPVGSPNTVTNGMQLLEGSAVTLSDGTYMPANGSIRMLVQNYCDLTLKDVTLDARNFPNVDYVLSNNCGYIVITGSTNIYAHAGKVAFDSCKFGSYEIPTVVFDENMTGTVDGIIEMTGGNLIIKGGTFKNTGMDFETFQKYVADGYVATEGNGVYTVTAE